MDKLPVELEFQILSFAMPQDLANYSLVSRAWYTNIQDLKLWNDVISTYFSTNICIQNIKKIIPKIPVRLLPIIIRWYYFPDSITAWNFWMEYFGNNILESFEISWEKFIVCFNDWFCSELKYVSVDYRCLKIMLTHYNNTIIKNLSDTIKWFGPFPEKNTYKKKIC